MHRTPTKRNLSRSTPQHLRWVAVLVTLAVLRIIYQSIQVSIHLSGPEDDGRPQLKALDVTLNSLRQTISFPGATRDSVPRRTSPTPKRQIQRPPPQRQSSLEWVDLKLSTKTLSLEVPSASTNQAKKYATFCRGLNQNSRVLISGITAHLIATEVAIVIGEHCPVQRIVGISHQAWQADMLPPLSYMVREQPGFTIYPDTLWSQQAMDDLITDLDPTHVLHFEPTSLLNSNNNSNNNTIPPAMAVRQSWLALQRCGRALGRVASEARVVYVTGSMISSSSSLLTTTAIRQIYPLGWQTFRQHYQVDVLKLELPSIYGPFQASALNVESILSRALGGLPAGHSNPKHTDDPSASMIHLDDAVDSILASMLLPATETTELPVVQIPSSLLVTYQQVQKAMTDARATTENTKILNDRSKLILSWHHQYWWPFDDATTVYGVNDTSKTTIRKALAMTNRRLEKKKPQGVSWLQRRAADLVPCTSECAENAPCIKSTVWTDEFMAITQNITQDCRFVVYTSDFSSNLQELPALKEKTQVAFQWPQETLCQVALVSEKSNFMQRVLKEQSRPLNGQVQSQKWTLVWIRESEGELSEADLLMPKIAPRPLFHHNVTRAMHIWDLPMIGGNSTTKKSPFPPRPVMWYLMAKQMDAKRQQARIKHGRRSGTSIPTEFWLPELPARHVSLFSQAVGFSSTFLKASSVYSMAKFLVKKQRQVQLKELPTRQLEYYELAHRTAHPITTLPDSFLLVHDLDSRHSKSFRCEWYEEHLVWHGQGSGSSKTKRHYYLEDLALAHILANRRAHGRLVGQDETWGERLIETPDLISSPIPDVTPTNATVPLPSQYFVKFYVP